MAKLLNLARRLTFCGFSPDKICKSCMKRKQEEKVNQTERTQAAKSVSLVHSD